MSSNTKQPTIQTAHFYPPSELDRPLHTDRSLYSHSIIETHVSEEEFQSMIEGECPMCGARLQTVTVNSEQWGQCTGSGYPYYHCRTQR